MDPSLRYESEGQKIPTFTDVVILHAPVGLALSVEDNCWLPNYFGGMCEVSIRTRLRGNKTSHSYHNLWCFS